MRSNVTTQAQSDWGLGNAYIPAIAHGHSKQLIFNLREKVKLNRRGLTLPPAKKSRKANYNNLIRYVLRFYAGLVVRVAEAGKGKHKICLITVLTPAVAGEDFYFMDVIIPYRDPTEYVQLITNMHSSEHAMARLMQRMPTIEEGHLHRKVLQQLAAVNIWFGDSGVDTGFGIFELGTGLGMAICAIGSAEDEDGEPRIQLTILTWIDAAKLRLDQSAEFGVWRKIGE